MSATTSLRRVASSRRDADTRSGRAAASPRVAALPRFGRAILTRIVVPVVLALAVLAALSTSSAATSLVVFAAAWAVLGFAAVTVGHDSTDGSSWTRRYVER